MPDKWRKLSTRTIASLTISMVGWRVFGPSPSARVIQEMGNAFQSSLVAAMGYDEPPETMAEKIKRLEHELMIEGHQYECAICIENNMTIHQKAIREMRRRFAKYR